MNLLVFLLLPSLYCILLSSSPRASSLRPVRRSSLPLLHNTWHCYSNNPTQRYKPVNQENVHQSRGVSFQLGVRHLSRLHHMVGLQLLEATAVRLHSLLHQPGTQGEDGPGVGSLDLLPFFLLVPLSRKVLALTSLGIRVDNLNKTLLEMEGGEIW